MKRKIVLVGAGSASFTQGLVMDLIKQGRGIKWDLALVDTDPKALEPMRIICSKMIEAKEADIELTWSVERKDVLSGAHYVVSTIGVGGRRAWEQDVFIPRKYGIFQPVGDSVAAGGISRAMRMIPAVLDITRDIMKLCPNAFFFNYANPMTAICRAVRKETGFPIIGLCHGVKNGERRIAKFAGLDRQSITSIAIGLNHMVFIYDLRSNGRDSWPEVKKKLARTGNLGIDTTIELGPLSRAFIEEFGVYPASDDRHFSEFNPSCLNENGYYGKTLGIDAFSFEKTIEDGDRLYEQTTALSKTDQPLGDDFFKRFEGEHEQLLDIILSIENDGKQVYSANLPNNGAVRGFSDEAILEMPTLVRTKGFYRIQALDFPEILTSLVNQHIAIAELTVEAALKGDVKLFEEAVLMGGYLSDRNAVCRMAGELIKAQKQYLPQFT